MPNNHPTLRLLPAATMLLATLLAACSDKRSTQQLPEGFATVPSSSTAYDESASSQKKASSNWSVDGNTMTYGSHRYTMEGNFDRDYTAGGTAKVTFTNVPSDLQEFTTVYEKFLGKKPYGVAAMLPMAFEMWGRNHDEGERCIEMIAGYTCHREIMRQLPPHMVASRFSPENDPYVQRCLPAAVLEGATKENGYNPTEPYTVNITIGREAAWGEESEILQANVYQLYILSGNAWNTPQRTVTVMLPWRGEQLYKVNSCPALYVNIFVPRQEWKGLK